MNKQIEVTLYFYERCSVGDADGFHVQTYESSDPDWGVLTGSCTVCVNRPGMSQGEITVKQVAGLNDKKRIIRAEALLKTNAIDDQISKLLALEAPKESE